MCLIVQPFFVDRMEEIKNSLDKQDYTNYQAVYLVEEGKNIEGLEGIVTASVRNHSYYSIKKVIKSSCQYNSLIVLVSNPLKHDALLAINEMHQSFSVYSSYSIKGSTV